MVPGRQSSVKQMTWAMRSKNLASSMLIHGRIDFEKPDNIYDIGENMPWYSVFCIAWSMYYRNKINTPVTQKGEIWCACCEFNIWPLT